MMTFSDSPTYSSPIFLEIIDCITSFVSELKEDFVCDPTNGKSGGGEGPPFWGAEKGSGSDRPSGVEGPESTCDKESNGGEKTPGGVEKKRSSGVEGAKPHTIASDSSHGKTEHQGFDASSGKTEHTSESLCCTIPLGDCNTYVFCLSTFMKNNKMLFYPEKSLVKQVLDYCMLDDEVLQASEALVNFGGHHLLHRTELLSLDTNKMIYTAIVESWALLLNKHHLLSNKKKCNFCFGVEYMKKSLDFLLDKKSMDSEVEMREILAKSLIYWVGLNDSKWDLNNVGKFFLPIYYQQHFSLLVVNVEDKILQYIDNYICSEDELVTYKTIVSNLLEGFQILLDVKEHPIYSEIMDYTMVVVDFKGRSKIVNLDCGVFLMMAMQFFNGENLGCDVSEAGFRTFWRGKICSSLVLSDMNKKRHVVLESINEFNLIKPAIEQDVVARQMELKKARIREMAEARKRVVEEKKSARKKAEKKAAADSRSCSKEKGKQKEF